MPAPIPFDAPVTIATFPFSFPIFILFPLLVWISFVVVFFKHPVNRISEGGLRSGHEARISCYAESWPTRFYPGVRPERPRRSSRGANSSFRAPLAMHVASGNARRYRQHCVV